MRRAVLLLVVVCVAALAAADSAAAATRECNGFQVCVPVVGPWVLATQRTETQYRLACPQRFVVGGVDAELSARALDVVFRAFMGAPVNPGISTSTEAIFLARLALGSDPAATFRPHIGCIPATGGGGRVPTAVPIYTPGRPTTLRVSEIAARAGVKATVQRRCHAGETLVSATHAIGFYTADPPTRAVATAVHATQTVAKGVVTLRLSAGKAIGSARTVVQLDLVCAGGSG